MSTLPKFCHHHPHPPNCLHHPFFCLFEFSFFPSSIKVPYWRRWTRAKLNVSPRSRFIPALFVFNCTYINKPFTGPSALKGQVVNNQRQSSYTLACESVEKKKHPLQKQWQNLTRKFKLRVSHRLFVVCSQLWMSDCHFQTASWRNDCTPSPPTLPKRSERTRLSGERPRRRWRRQAAGAAASAPGTS